MTGTKKYIGIDLGTSSVKILLVDEAGVILKSVTKDYPISYPNPGWSEQEPADWWQACCAGIKELLDGLTGTRWQHVGNPCQVPLDVWQPTVQVIVVRAHQVRDKVAHGRAFYHCLRWRIVVVAIHLRDKQKKLGSHTVLTAHLRYGFVAKPQWNAKVRECEQQLRLRCHQCRQVVGCRINKFTHDISIVINVSNYTQVYLTDNVS